MTDQPRCPFCMGTITQQDRSPDGNSTCERMHCFPSRYTYHELRCKNSLAHEILQELRHTECAMGGQEYKWRNLSMLAAYEIEHLIDKFEDPRS